MAPIVGLAVPRPVMPASSVSLAAPGRLPLFGLSSAAYGRSGSDPGITADTILLGATVPLSGDEVAYAAVARGSDAYFRYVNDHGGVRGRKIRFHYVDDAYNPAETVRKTRQLVEDDKVFAIFGSVGTEHALAVRPYLNQVGVPQLFVGSGLSALALEHKRYPETMGYLPRFAGEARALRAVRRPHAAAREDRRPLRGLRVRAGHVHRAEARARLAVDADQGRRDVRALRSRPECADGAPQGLEGRHRDDLRPADADDPGLSGDPQARLEAADLRQLGLDRPVRDGCRAEEHGQEARRGRDLEPVPQGSDRSDAGQGPRSEALQADPAQLPPGRQGQGGRAPVRNGRRVHDGGRAPPFGRAADAGEPAPRGNAPERARRTRSSSRASRSAPGRTTTTRSSRRGCCASTRAAGASSADSSRFASPPDG